MALGEAASAVGDLWSAVAVDSTVLWAKGGEWHKKGQQAGVVLHSSIDTEAGWTKSGWHGWVYGWKLHLACTVASVWIPLAARLTPANVSDNKVAPSLIAESCPMRRASRSGTSTTTPKTSGRPARTASGSW